MIYSNTSKAHTWVKNTWCKNYIMSVLFWISQSSISYTFTDLKITHAHWFVFAHWFDKTSHVKSYNVDLLGTS